MNRRRLLTLACFLALAAVTALVVSRVSHPPVTGLLVSVALLAGVAGGVGVVRPRLWPLALVLLPLGAYLVARLQMGLPADTPGVDGHVAFYAGRVADGAAVYARQNFPLDPAPADLRLLLSLFVYGVIGAAAFFALSLRRPLPGVVILLCLAGFGFTIDEAARDPWAALAFVMLAGGLLALAHPLPRARAHLADALTGGATATVAVVLALSVLGVTTVEAGRPLQDWRTWDITGPGNALMRFDWMQNYPRLLARDNDAVVMEVRSPVASYWRANVLSDFNGTVWRSGLDDEPLSRGRADGSWTYEVPRTADRGVQGRSVTQRFDIRSTYTDHLFVGGWASEVRTLLPLDLSASDAATVSVAPPRGPRTSYEVEAFVPELAATNLIGLGRSYPAEIADDYLQLPFPALDDVAGPEAEDRWQAAVAAPASREWAGLYRLNQSVVGAEAEPYRVALAIHGYLTGPGFEYSLRPPESDYTSPYAAFLFDTHIGYCQHFAGAMALLLRFNGIPARVVVGFAQGTEQSKGVFLVRRNDAHAWVEAYFPGAGWAQFEPTPGRQMPDSSTSAGSADGADAAGGSAGGAAGDPGAPPDLPGRARVNDPGGPGDLAGAVAEAPARWPWAVALVALLAGWPVGRALLRRRGLLASAPEARLRASVSLVYATLRDHGIDVPSSQTLDETARLLQERYGVDAGDVPARVQAITFGGRPATPGDVAALRALRLRVAASLRARRGRLARFAALYGLGRRRPLTPQSGSPTPVATRRGPEPSRAPS
jgi:transglutaminase-like putative cysteine protease